MIKSEVNIFDNDLDDNDGKFQILQAFRTRKNLNNEEDDQPLISNILMNKLSRELRVKFDDAQTQIFHAPTQDYSQNQSEIENEYQLGNYTYQKSKTNSPGKYQNTVRKLKEIEDKVIRQDKESKNDQKDCKIHVHKNLYSSENQSLNTKNIMRGKFTLKVNKRLTQQQLIEEYAQEPIIFHLHKNRKFMLKLEKAFHCDIKSKEELQHEKIEMLKLEFQKQKDKKEHLDLKSDNEFSQNNYIRPNNHKKNHLLSSQVKKHQTPQRIMIKRQPLYQSNQLFKFKDHLPSCYTTRQQPQPQVIKTMFALREEDVKQKDEDIENVRLEHIQQKMNPNRYAAQLEKIQRTKNTKYKQ
eukprot:403349120